MNGIKINSTNFLTIVEFLTEKKTTEGKIIKYICG